jgi:hypothetical protein
MEKWGFAFQRGFMRLVRWKIGVGFTCVVVGDLDVVASRQIIGCGHRWESARTAVV